MYQTRFSTLSQPKRNAVKNSLNFFALIFLLAVTSCGFKPLYEKHEGEKSHSCTNFTVSKVKNYLISGQKMQYELQDRLNQACINQDKQYRVEVEIIKGKNAIAIQKDREVTRYSLNLTGTYKVYENDAVKPVNDGISLMVGSYDAAVSNYGTYALEEDTQAKLLKEMANDISLKISSQLLRNK